MPDEPNKQMDDLLKAYARQRRKAEPDLRVHPATRRLLQGEVRRTFGTHPNRGSWIGRLGAFWPQIAFAGSLCLILGIAVLSLRQRPEEPVLQRATSSPAKDTLDQPNRATTVSESPLPTPSRAKSSEAAPFFKEEGDTDGSKSETLQRLEDERLRVAPVPEEKKLLLERKLPLGGLQENETRQKPAVAAEPLSSSVQEARKSALSPRTVPSADQSLVTAPLAIQEQAAAARGEQSQRFGRASESLAEKPAPISKQQTGRGQISNTRDAQNALGVADSIAGIPTSPSLAAASIQADPADKLGRVNEITNLGAARRLQFYLVSGVPPDPALSNASLFSSFQVEQLGQQVRFLDQDGSVYLGTISDPTNPPSPKPAALLTRTEVRTTPPTLPDRGYRSAGGAPQLSRSATNAPAFNFTARGTNRTLGKDVLLTGQYFEKTNIAPSRLDLKASKAVRAPAPEPQHLIIGTALVGATNQIPLRAVTRE